MNGAITQHSLRGAKHLSKQIEIPVEHEVLTPGAPSMSVADERRGIQPVAPDDRGLGRNAVEFGGKRGESPAG